LVLIIFVDFIKFKKKKQQIPAGKFNEIYFLGFSLIQAAHLASISSLKSPFSRLNFVIIELPLDIEKQQIIQILLFTSWQIISFLASLPQRVHIDIIRFAQP